MSGWLAEPRRDGSYTRLSTCKADVETWMNLTSTFQLEWDDRQRRLVVREWLSARDMTVSYKLLRELPVPRERSPLLRRVLAMAPLRVHTHDVDIGVNDLRRAGHGTQLRVLVPDKYSLIVEETIQRVFAKIFGGVELRARGQATDVRWMYVFEVWPRSDPSAQTMSMIALVIAVELLGSD